VTDVRLADLSVRMILRVVLTVVAVGFTLYLIYRLRKPIGWVLIATFLAIALSGPVNWLERRLRRGLAIAIVYVGLLLIPLTFAALIVPPFVREGNKLADRAPRYARDVTDYVEKNDRLRKLNKDYDITGKLQDEAGKLPGKLGGAAGTLRDVGFGIVNSIFQLVTILILTAFLLGSGRLWVVSFLNLQPPDRRERLRLTLERMSSAVGNYVAGAIAQAALAGVLTYFVLLILGVPFAAPLAAMIFFLDLIPLVGATVGAFIVGIVTVFVSFPTTTIIWVIWAIVYQQVENSVIQPRIQRRAVDVHPFVVLVAVLFGSTLLGIIGALIAIPLAASAQIIFREWVDYRRMLGTPEPPPAPGEEPAPA
jgi:predicted PurR-regulated permease PerM